MYKPTITAKRLGRGANKETKTALMHLLADKFEHSKFQRKQLAQKVKAMQLLTLRVRSLLKGEDRKEPV